MPEMSFKAWLVEHGITQTSLAKTLGVSLAITNAKVNGRSRWTLDQIRTICKTYGVSADIFLREELH